jgi:putative FmdB family regulatory protein
MPRYVYRCDSCNNHFQVRHGMKERQESCILCESLGNLVRVPQMPNIKKHATDSKQDVGNLTKQSIEENRKLLSEMKEEARNQTYGN